MSAIVIILPEDAVSILRIEITSARRRWLNRMASEAGKSVDELAAGLLSDLIDDDAKAHGEAG